MTYREQKALLNKIADLEAKYEQLLITVKTLTNANKSTTTPDKVDPHHGARYRDRGTETGV